MPIPSTACPIRRARHGYRVIHSINPHDERGDIEWEPHAFERLYKRITGKVRENRTKISTVQRFGLDDADIALVAFAARCALPSTPWRWPGRKGSRPA